MDDSVFDPQAQLRHPDLKIVASLERLSEAFRVLLWEKAKNLAVSPIQIQILIFLHYQGEEKRKVTYLAREFNMSKATVSEAVKTLEQKGLLERRTEPHDTRSHTLHLTGNGRLIVEQTALFANPVLSALGRIPPEKREILLENLLLLIGQLQQTGIISIQRTCFLCRFYQKTEAGHFCKFLGTPLKSGDLRVDCPEFEAESERPEELPGNTFRSNKGNNETTL